MVGHNEQEDRLIDKIVDSKLRISVELIRQAMKSIWGSDSPRIIQDYTEHGEKHAQRIIKYVAKIIELNTTKKLSEKELYLLLGSIYLHDIGMQCDVLKFPEILKGAIELGAEFTVDFTAPSSNKYTENEQKEIRKNHQYLSAAWIDYANQTGETALGPAAKTIPEDLINDLMDVCKYHSKLPISECQYNFEFYQNLRKQFVAALLRFSDELDIDSNRVNINTIMDFRLDPNNSLYWWLHNRTYIEFTAPNVITITIRLNPEDKDHYGDFIHKAFIAKFFSKNKPVLAILNKHGIPIAMNMDSVVLDHSRAKKLPNKIIKVIELMQNERDQEVEIDKKINEATLKHRRNRVRKERYSKKEEESTETEQIPSDIFTIVSGCLKNISEEYLNILIKIEELIDQNDGETKKNPKFIEFIMLFLLNVKRIFDTLTKDTCSVSIKILDNNSNIKTFARDPISYRHRSKIDRILPQYSFDSVTSFHQIIGQKYIGNYYLSNDLESERYYNNVNPNWNLYYKACIVVPIRRNLGKKKWHIVGFLTVDNFFGGFERAQADLLSTLSNYLYYLFYHKSII